MNIFNGNIFVYFLYYHVLNNHFKIINKKYVCVSPNEFFHDLAFLNIKKQTNLIYISMHLTQVFFLIL